MRTTCKIVVTEIPYGVNKQQLIEYIADLVKEGKLEGISNVNDETGRQGMRIVVDVKRDANANVILNKLFKMTALQSSFSVNCIALVAGRPRLLSLRECIKYLLNIVTMSLSVVLSLTLRRHRNAHIS